MTVELYVWVRDDTIQQYMYGMHLAISNVCIFKFVVYVCDREMTQYNNSTYPSSLAISGVYHIRYVFYMVVPNNPF